MGASLDDILTTQKNGVQGINGLTHATQNLAGTVNSYEISASTYLATNANWCAKVSVIVAGSTTGMIYDASSVTTAVTGVRLAVIPNTVGIYTINMPVNKGIVITPGTGMIVAVSYS
jgi:uncharacterized hydantoinase/oxoprolinase family protein